MPLEHFFRSSALFCIYRLHPISCSAGSVSTFTRLLSAPSKFRYPLDITNSDSEDHKAEQRDDFELTGVTRLQGERQKALPKLKEFLNELWALAWQVCSL